MFFAEIAVDTYQDPRKKLFTYQIPIDLATQVAPGVSVVIPFGKRTAEGYVWQVSSKKPLFPTKPIQSVKKRIFSDKQVQLARWMADHYLASPLECLKCQLIGKGERSFSANPEKITTLVLVPYASQVKIRALASPTALVGSRSAVFSQLPHLQKIIIEEPESWNYKDERAPYYHATEVAQKRAKLEKLSLELRYQTPRVEDLWKISKTNKDSKIRKSLARFNGWMPFKGNKKSRIKAVTDFIAFTGVTAFTKVVEIVDLNREKLAGNFTFVSQPMEAALSSRKYSLVYVHSRELREGIEEELRKLGPDKNFYKIIGPELFALPGQEAFHTIWADVDTLLNLPDFRAHEKIVWTVQKLNQLTKGKLFLQTSSPDNPLFKNLESGPLDVAQGRPERSRMGGQLNSFYRRELENRKKFSFPPFATLVKLSCSAKSSAKVHLEMGGLYERLTANSEQRTAVEISPPYEPYAKTPGKVQLNIAVKLKNKGAKQKEETLVKLSKIIPPDWKVEVDPESLL